MPLHCSISARGSNSGRLESSSSFDVAGIEQVMPNTWHLWHPSPASLGTRSHRLFRSRQALQALEVLGRARLSREDESPSPSGGGRFWRASIFGRDRKELTKEPKGMRTWSRLQRHLCPPTELTSFSLNLIGGVDTVHYTTRNEYTTEKENLITEKLYKGQGIGKVCPHNPLQLCLPASHLPMTRFAPLIVCAVTAFAFPQYGSLADLSDRELAEIIPRLNYVKPTPPPGPLNDMTPKLVNDKAHPWMPLREGDQRGPCPGLNTLASHGVR
ncbi:hypothetical protein M422DRAFT_274941 [Sphaerobolus stellatus SS14]|uniref:Heme haloperoxidase family profile domain-containing protein n=1 Tax=Sphaerobolus stellatus (strain SS14) TaxID=990650 RepID=A0A0C9UFS8_SPHS4|nr:hypothetical protein M422DRAFT_274941 [Sphaerobolus stellatus SS14]